MKKLSLIMLSLFLMISIVSCKKDTDNDNSTNDNTNNGNIIEDNFIADEQIISNMNTYIDSLIAATPSYTPAWNMEGFKGRWNYIDGVFLNSIVNLYYNLKDTDIAKANKYRNFFLSYIDYYLNSNGEFINPKTQETNYRAGELDSICESKILFDAYQLTNDSKYINAINFTYNSLLEMDIVDNSNGNYSHKNSYADQIWLDGMYMYVPFNARYSVSMNKPSELDKIKKQYEFMRNNMFDNDKKLYYHAYTSKGMFWSNNKPGTSPSFWLRSMGWYIVSLVDVLEYYPEGNNKEYLKGLLKEAIEGLMQYQDSTSKMFYQVIDKKDTKVVVPAKYLEGLKNTKYLNSNGEYKDTEISNYLESSGSSMIAYTLMKGAKLGYLDSKYLQEGREIFEGIYNHSFKNNKLNNICITAGLGPETNLVRDGSIYYYLAEPVGSNDAKGVGPFIMAYLEYAYKNSVKTTTPNIETCKVEFKVNNTIYKTISVRKNGLVTKPINPALDGYEFVSWQYNGVDFNFNTKITTDIVLTAKFEKIESYYEKIIKMNSLVYSNDFNSYQATDKLSEFSSWKNQGVYSRYNDKENDQEIDKSKNYIVLGKGYAELVDLSNDGIQLYTDLSTEKKNINKAYLACDIRMPVSVKPWTPFQLYGTSVANTNISEVLGITINNFNLSFGYRFDGDSNSNRATTICSKDNTWHQLYIEIDYNLKQLLIKIDNQIVYNGNTTITGIAGFRVVSRDNEQYSIHVDNIAYAVE